MNYIQPRNPEEAAKYGYYAPCMHCDKPMHGITDYKVREVCHECEGYAKAVDLHSDNV